MHHVFRVVLCILLSGCTLPALNPLGPEFWGLQTKDDSSPVRQQDFKGPFVYHIVRESRVPNQGLVPITLVTNAVGYGNWTTSWTYTINSDELLVRCTTPHDLRIQVYEGVQGELPYLEPYVLRDAMNTAVHYLPLPPTARPGQILRLFGECLPR
jgi:hypothetical protein